jgi:hypothetical protein
MNAADLRNELIEVLARHPRAFRTNTPLEVLATHMVTAMQLFEASLLERSNHDFFRPGREKAGPDVAVRSGSDGGGDHCGLYRDRPRPACEACED